MTAQELLRSNLAVREAFEAWKAGKLSCSTEQAIDTLQSATWRMFGRSTHGKAAATAIGAELGAYLVSTHATPTPSTCDEDDANTAPGHPTVPLAEAPGSANLYLDLPGYGRVQATGRGTTGAEAARNLRETITALQTEFAPTPPALLSREEHLGQLLARGLSKAVTHGDPSLVDRLIKATHLVLEGAVTPATDGDGWHVRSLSSQTVYAVSADLICSCPDYAKRHGEGGAGRLCKHGVAAAMERKLGHAVPVA